MERGSKEIVSFIVTVFLARLLEPNDFGLVAIVFSFISLTNVIVQTGFNAALLQKKNICHKDYSSTFTLSIFFAILFALILFLSSTFLSEFYKSPLLKNIISILACTLPFGAYNSIQMAFLTRSFDYKKVFICTIGSILLSGGIGIILAVKGYGVWALVGQYISTQLSLFIFLLLFSTLKLTLNFDLKSIKTIVTFGWKIAAASVLDAIYTNLFNMIIGKKYSPDMLAFFNRGRQLPLLLAQDLNTSIGGILLTTYSKMQADISSLKATMRRSIISSAFVMFPLMVGLAVCAKPFVVLVFSEKWIFSVPYMQLFCIVFIFYPINMANTQAINGVGRSDIFLTINILKKLFGVIILLVTINISVFAVAIGLAFGSIFNLLINVLPNKLLFQYGLKEQLRDVFPSFVLSIFMGLGIALILLLPFSYSIILPLQIGVGILLYLGASHLFKLEAYKYVRETLIGLLREYKLKWS